MIRTRWFDQWARYAPSAIALEDRAGARRFSYAQSNSIIHRLAHVLRDELSLRRGDRIAVLATNSVEYVFLFFAAQCIEAILVPMNYRLTARELRHVLRDSEPALLVVQQRFDAIAREALPAECSAAMISLDGDDGLKARMHDNSRRDDAIGEDVDFDTPCMVLYTSGTTGAPKGAIITHGMLFWNSINTSMRLNLVQSDVTLTFAPFFHTGGWNVLTTPFLHRGGSLILLDRFDPAEVLRLCDERGVSILFGVPTMMDMMAREALFEEVSLASVRYAIVGGEPMPVELIRIWQNKGVPIRQGYGLTEFGPNVFSLNEEDAIRKIGSIGFPNFYIDARIVDDAGAELGADAVGELVLRGPVCTPGYWRNEEATRMAIRDGWFHTGDLVRRDSEGYYYVVDRKKDMYISGAENVYPAEVEHFLRTLPGVKSVAVIGVPDATWGEVGKAYIVREVDATLTADDVLRGCAGNLAKFKIPKYVEFLDALPVSDSGKILKKQLRVWHDERTHDS